MKKYILQDQTLATVTAARYIWVHIHSKLSWSKLHVLTSQQRKPPSDLASYEAIFSCCLTTIHEQCYKTLEGHSLNMFHLCETTRSNATLVKSTLSSLNKQTDLEQRKRIYLLSHCNCLWLTSASCRRTASRLNWTLFSRCTCKCLMALLLVSALHGCTVITILHCWSASRTCIFSPQWNLTQPSWHLIWKRTIFTTIACKISPRLKR